jgi:hypothetical protein
MLNRRLFVQTDENRQILSSDRFNPSEDWYLHKAGLESEKKNIQGM